MKKINKSLHTQSSYAKLIGVSRQRVNKMIEEGKLITLQINGAVLIQTKTDDQNANTSL